MASGMRMLLLLLPAAVALASGALAQTRGFVWTGEDTPAPVLRFGAPGGSGQAFRISCDASGTRLVVFTRGIPRSLPADSQTFETRLKLFLGRTEFSLGGLGSRTEDGNSRVEALLPEPTGPLFEAMARQGRLTVVHFAGRTKAPAPEADMVARFRAACPPVPAVAAG
jgi:hypothetical protein